MYYAEIFQAFNKNKVAYAVIGGIAINLLGIPRATADLDVFADLSRGNLEKIINILAGLKYKSRLSIAPTELLSADKRRRFVEKKNLRAFTFYNVEKPYQEVDILISAPFTFQEIADNINFIRAGAITIPVMAAADLLKLKKISRRQQDMADIEALKKLELLREKGD